MHATGIVVAGDEDESQVKIAARPVAQKPPSHQGASTNPFQTSGT